MQMKISSFQIVKHISSLHLLFLSIFFISFSNTGLSQEGEQLFKTQCANCHQIHVQTSYPKLYKVREKWEEAEEGDLIYEWVQNNAKLRASGKSKRANKVFKDWNGANMTLFETLSKDQITSIFDYVDSQEPGSGAGDTAQAGGPELSNNEDGGVGWMWYILGAIFITIILSVGGVRRQLKRVTSESEEVEKSTYSEEFRAWAWKNRKYVGIGSIVIVMSLLVSLYNVLGNINVMEGYQPSQPIAFPHSVHAGINGIDCKYCHNSVTKSRTAGIPSVNVCMNCHKVINGRTKPAQQEIQKIYDAAGWDTLSKKYSGVEKPIVWNKVHILPDHVYFNHSQHVVAGGLDCKQCHGDMTTMTETAKVNYVKDLNEIEGNVKLTKPTLTMGWCIECHGKYEISIGDGSNAYYQEMHERLKKEKGQRTYKRFLNDNKGVSVAELGGWECAKCHY